MRKFDLLLIGMLLSSTAYAGGVSPYLPLNINPQLESDIERLVVVSNISKVTKPYSISVLFQSLPRIREQYPDLYSRLHRQLRGYRKSAALTQSKITLTASSEDAHPLPNARGTTTKDRYHLSTRAQWQVDDWLGLYIGTELSEQHKQLTGTTLSVGTSWAQLDVGYRDHWYSPFLGHSQVMSTNAKTLPSLTLSNNLPIRLFNTPINYELFLAQTERQPVLYQGTWSEKNRPLLAGFHFSVEPVEGWSLGVNRVVQFAGGERGVSFKTLLKAFIDPNGSDNTHAGLDSDSEAGNQVASIVSRMNFDTSVPFSVVAELAGEDTSNGKNYQFGNPALSFGIHFPMLLDDKLSLNYEQTYWGSGWYSHHLYKDGYVNDKFVLGNWAMQQQRALGTAFEGESHYIKAQYRFNNKHSLITQMRLVTQKDAAKQRYNNSWEMDVEYFMPWRRHVISFGGYGGKDILGKSFWQARFGFRWK